MEGKIMIANEVSNEAKETVPLLNGVHAEILSFFLPCLVIRELNIVIRRLLLLSFLSDKFPCMHKPGRLSIPQVQPIITRSKH